MQAEIEALLRAYQVDKEREAKLVTDLLTALAVSAANRQRLIDDFAQAIQQLQSGQVAARQPTSAPAADPLEQAVAGLRQAAAH